MTGEESEVPQWGDDIDRNGIPGDTYVYIMSSGSAAYPRCKIGISCAPRNRAQHLNTSSPYRVEIVQAWLVGTKADARSIEKEVHKELKDRRVQGEWFKCQSHIAMRVLHDVLRDRDLLDHRRLLGQHA
jgi:hypothetical protein